jgi:hypothetical protein
MINHLFLKASLTDGCSVAEDILTIFCPTATPTATATPTITPTMTMTPTPTQKPPSDLFFFLSDVNNLTYSLDNNIVAKFIVINEDISSIVIRIPSVNTSSSVILTLSDLIYNNKVIGQLQFDSTRIIPGSELEISFIDSNNTLISFTNVVLASPRINLN